MISSLELLLYHVNHSFVEDLLIEVKIYSFVVKKKRNLEGIFFKKKNSSFE